MMAMLSPDLLDRRALALLELRDPMGRVPDGHVRILGDGLRIYAKGAGRFAVLGAAGFESYVSSFVAPAAPAVGSVSVPMDIRISGQALLPRRADLKLPRDPDPAGRANANNLHNAALIQMFPAPSFPIPANAAAVRIVVRKQGDGRRVANALVRLVSNTGNFRGSGLSDACGEALIIIPNFPTSFPGPQAKLQDFLAAKLHVAADPARAVLVAEDGLLAAQAAAAQKDRDFIDPDALARDFPLPALTGANSISCQLSTRRVAALTAEWRAP
jgi:hypothetical protein